MYDRKTTDKIALIKLYMMQSNTEYCDTVSHSTKRRTERKIKNNSKNHTHPNAEISRRSK